MNGRIGVVLMAALASPLLGCESGDIFGLRTAEAPLFSDAPIQTERSSYRVRTTPTSYEVTIRLTYTNGTASTAYISGCRGVHPPILQKWEDGEWVNAYSPAVPGCLGHPAVIEPGEAFEYTYDISASRRPNTFPRWEADEIPGTYRLVWFILRTWAPYGPEPGLGEALPEELRVSHSFELTG